MPVKKSGRVRVDGGKWRGRYLSFDSTQTIRPSKSIVKKTLFNWIRPSLAGACCLDMFAGSGSLGFEAASQGAEQVAFLDSAAKTISVINKNIQLIVETALHFGGATSHSRFSYFSLHIFAHPPPPLASHSSLTSVLPRFPTLVPALTQIRLL